MAKKTKAPKSDPKRKSASEAGKKASRPKPAPAGSKSAPAKSKDKSPAKKKPAAPVATSAPKSKPKPKSKPEPKKPAAAPKPAKPTKVEPPAPKKPAPEPKADKKSKPVTVKQPPKPAAAPKKAPASGKRDTSADKRPPQTNLADAQAAALRLAAAAGLRPVQKHTDNGEAPVAEAKRLTKSPLNKRDLDRYRAILMEKRSDVVGDVSEMEKEALAAANSGSLSTMPQHMADQGSDEYDQSLALGLAASQRMLLKEIDDAIDRIDNGTYGVCEVLGVAIHKDRLEATPWARYCLDGARMVDRQMHHAR